MSKNIFVCPNCDAEYDNWKDANDCKGWCVCIEPIEMWQCGKCGTNYETKKEADKCCKKEVKQK